MLAAVAVSVPGADARRRLVLWPINKNLWTPTFTLINAAIGLGLLALLKIVWPRIGASPRSRRRSPRSVRCR